MRMMRFKYTISHVPGKQLLIADMLSRAPTEPPSTNDPQFEAHTQAFVNTVLQAIPATEQRLTQIKEAQSQDRVCIQVKQYCQTQWPNRISLSKELFPYYLVHTELSWYYKVPGSSQTICLVARTHNSPFRKCQELHRMLQKPVSECRTHVVFLST